VGKVNVVLPSGRVVAVDEDVAAASQLSRDTTAQEAAQVTGDLNEERTSGIAEGAKAAGEGLADTLTGGLYGAVRGAVDTDYRRNAAIRGQERGGSRFLGEAAGLLAPTGLLGDAAKGASELSALGLASRAGEAVGGGAGRIVEGALYGVGGEIASTNVSGDPLTIEGALEGASVGGILNLGAGMIADGLGAKAESLGWDTRLQRAKAGIAEEGERAFETSQPTYAAFKDSHEAAVSAGEKYNREVAKEQSKYDSFVDSNRKLTTATDRAQKAVNDVRNRYTAENPAGPELQQRLKDYQERISRIYKIKGGGWDVDETGRWARDASAAADPKRALEELRAVQGDLMRDFPQASGKLSDLPDAPRQSIAVSKVKLPDALSDFSRMHAESIANLANDLDPASVDALGRLTDDLGLARGATPAETVAAVHGKLRTFNSTINELKADTAAKMAAESKQPLILRALKSAAGAAVGDVFGFNQAVLGAMGGGIGGRLASHLPGLDAVLLGAKSSIADRVRSLVEKWGGSTARGIDALGPVTAYLSRSFPSGNKDTETNLTRQAANRVADIVNANMIAPDASFTALGGLMGHPADIAGKMHQQLLGALNYLMVTAPKDPGLDTRMFTSNWAPALSDAIALAHRLEAVQNPVGAIARAMAGGAHPAGTEALWSVWNATMQELSREVAFQSQSLANLNYQRASVYSNLFRTPMTALQQPLTVTALQGMYMNASRAAAAPTKSSRPVGRPAAVQSPVAGSNVAALISQ
jgi:hypothetical protein